MDIGKQVRVFVTEELDKQLGEIRDQIAGLSSRVDEVEREQGNKWNLFLRLRKHTIDELMAEYSKIKKEMYQKTEEQAEI